MKIISLTSENIKRLIAVEIRPDGNLVAITGKNGAGKSSVLDSIWWALSGAKHIQAQPIRKGENKARIQLDMGEIVVTRTFKREAEGEGYTTKLEVVGNVKGSPQAMLDSLLDSLAFDPLAFARMDPKAQFEAIRKYVPDVDFDKLAAQNSIDFSNRADLNRQAKEKRTLAGAIVVAPEAPKERIDETALVSELTAAGQANTDRQMRIERRANLSQQADHAMTRAEGIRKEIQRMIAEADMLEASAVGIRTKLADAGPVPDAINLTEIQAKITRARLANAFVAKREQKAAHETEATTLEMRAKDLTAKMANRDKAKLEAIAKAKLPVEQLSFGDGIVLLGGLPFEQASDAEQLKASCALAMAGNPQLRVLRVRDGSLLDEESLALLGKMAEEKDFQIWVERVEPGKCGFVIEDGQLRQAAEVAQ